jgi:hypothetical protein
MKRLQSFSMFLALGVLASGSAHATAFCETTKSCPPIIINGTVLDQKGQPVQFAQVQCNLVGGDGLAVPNQTGLTDGNGHYSVVAYSASQLNGYPYAQWYGVWNVVLRPSKTTISVSPTSVNVDLGPQPIPGEPPNVSPIPAQASATINFTDNLQVYASGTVCGTSNCQQTGITTCNECPNGFKLVAVGTTYCGNLGRSITIYNDVCR